MSRKLTEKQELFVKYYLINLNAAESARLAGYSKKSCYQIGHENLTKPYISERIQEEMDKRSERVKMTADDVLREIIELMERNKKTDDKLSLDALKLLGKHHKLFTDKIEHSGNVDITSKSKLVDKYLGGD